MWQSGVDNTEYFNSILTDGSGPLHIVIPAGVFLFSAPLQSINRSVRIEGAGVEGTVLLWTQPGGLTFSGDYTHRFKCTDLSFITTVENNPSPAITIKSTDTYVNTIGNQHKVEDVVIRVSGFAGGGYFTTGILVDGGVNGIGNVAIRDLVVQGNSAVGPIANGKRAPIINTKGIHSIGRTYGIMMDHCQFTWLDYAFKGQDQVETAQWVGSSAGACRYGFYVDSLTFPSGIANSMTVERGDFACIHRPIYLHNVWQASIHSNTIHNFDYPIPQWGWAGIDFVGNCSQNRISNNLIYPHAEQQMAVNKVGVIYSGTHSIISQNPTIRCTAGIYLSPTSSYNTIANNRDCESGSGIADTGTSNIMNGNTHVG